MPPNSGKNQTSSAKQRLIVVFILLLTSNISTYAQFEKGEYSYMQRHFMLFFNGGILTEGGKTGIISYTRGANNDVSASYVNFASVGLEPKLNLFEKDDEFSISVNTPFDLGPTIINNDYTPFRMRFGAFVSWNTGNGSTFSNVNRYGYGIGLGFRYSVLLGGEYMGLTDRSYLTPTLKFDVVNTPNFQLPHVRGFTISVGLPGRATNSEGERVLSNFFIGMKTRFKFQR